MSVTDDTSYDILESALNRLEEGKGLMSLTGGIHGSKTLAHVHEVASELWGILEPAPTYVWLAIKLRVKGTAVGEQLNSLMFVYSGQVALEKAERWVSALKSGTNMRKLDTACAHQAQAELSLLKIARRIKEA